MATTGAATSGETPSSVLAAAIEATPSSGVLSSVMAGAIETAAPTNPADDPLIVVSSASDGYNTGDSDSSMRTTVFDIPPQPPSSFPELGMGITADPSPGAPPAESPSHVAIIAPAGAAPPPARAATTSRISAALSSPSPLLFKIAVSYASAMTLACLYLAYLLSQRNPTLDLPDLAPPAKSENRVTTLLYVPPEAEIHPSQKLRLGVTRQFGSLRITPLRVARGPLHFTYFDPLASETRPASEPVLKLYLRFENISRSQEVVPLDRHLVFTKEPDRDNFGRFKANNFVCAAGERSQPDRHVLAYDLSPESEWLIENENLDLPLKPGEVVESFVPTTEENWNALSGGLVWRVHLRKGYNPSSMRGVTTLIEVLFDSSEIVDESSPKYTKNRCGSARRRVPVSAS